ADPVTRAQLLAVVAQRAAAGAAVVYTTHYLPELAELRATVAVARAGRVVARGTLREVSLDRVDALLASQGQAEEERDGAAAAWCGRPDARVGQAQHDADAPRTGPGDQPARPAAGADHLDAPAVRRGAGHCGFAGRHGPGRHRHAGGVLVAGALNCRYRHHD